MLKCRSQLQYSAIPTHVTRQGIGGYDTYGLSVTIEDRKYTIRDVSTNHRKAELLAELFTRVQLSPLHLLDALEDML